MGQTTTSPYKNTYFLLFISAMFITNTGTWPFAVGSGWLMTELNSSALMVSLVQTATFIPLFLLAIPAGAIGDIFKRKRVLILFQVFLILNTTLFAWIVYTDRATTFLLLLFTLLNGVGAAFSRPILAALIPEMVAKSQLRTAVTLMSISFNLGRAIGPILGGILITLYAIDTPFWVDAVTFAAVVIVILFYKQEQAAENDLPREQLTHAMGGSIRFLWYTPPLYNSLIRAAFFFFPAAALWALMPLVAKEQLSGAADVYGYLLGASGFGAVSSILYSNKLAEKVGANLLLMGSTILIGISFAFLGMTSSLPIALTICFLAGTCWQLAFTSLMTSAQYSLPQWYGARGMAYFLMIMSGSLGIGSILWGSLADYTSIQTSFWISAGIIVLIAFVSRPFKLDTAKDADFSVADDVDELQLEVNESGAQPLRVIHTYHIGDSPSQKALDKIRTLRNKRYRSGAKNWKIDSTEKDEGKITETYLFPSIDQYKRHSRLITQDDFDDIIAIRKWITTERGSITSNYKIIHPKKNKK